MVTNIGDEFDVTVTFPERIIMMSELCRQGSCFQVQAQRSISYEELPEINDDLIKDATEFDTVDEYRADIKSKLEEAAVQQADSAFENAVMNALIEKVDAPIPNCMFEQRIDALMRSFEQQLRQQGMDLKLYFQYTGMDADSFRDTYRDRAVNEVKLRLALEKIAEVENLEPTEEEINNGLTDVAAANNMDVETVKRFIPMEDYIEDLRVQKAVDLVKENAVVDNTPAEDKAE